MVWSLIFDYLGILLVNYLFKTNYSKRLRQPYIDLRHRFHLEHQNLISNLSIIRFQQSFTNRKSCRVNCRIPDNKKNRQSVVGDDFCTISTYKTFPSPPEPSTVPEYLKIKLKSTHIFPPKCKIRPSPQRFHPMRQTQT